MAIVRTILAECAGCPEVIVPSGPDQVLVGAAVAVVAMIPGVVLHRFLRRRNR